MAAHLQRFAASFGVEGLTVRDRIPSTRRALAVAELARSSGRLDAYRTAAMAAWWREGRDLEDDAGLAHLAAAAGIDPAEAVQAADDPRWLGRVDALRAEASRRGVTGIPTFVFADRATVVGCQPYGILAAAAESVGARRR